MNFAENHLLLAQSTTRSTRDTQVNSNASMNDHGIESLLNVLAWIQGQLAWCCYFLLGAGLLAPWNAFITAVDYFGHVYPNPHMDRLFTVCYLPMCLILLGLMIAYKDAFDIRSRVITSYIGFAVLMLLVPLLDLAVVAGKPQAPKAAMALVLISVLVVGTLDGMCQGAVFGDAAQLPRRFTHAVVGGTATSGVLVCVLRIISRAVLDRSPGGLRTSTALYFALAAVISLLCAAAYILVLPKLDIIQFYRNKAQVGELLEVPCMSFGSGEELEAGAADVPDGTDATGPLPLDSQLRAVSDLVTQDTLFATNPQLASKHHHAEIRACLLKLWPLMLSNFAIYTVTLSIFPGFLAEDVHSSQLGDWYAIILITLFNAADLTGKLLPDVGLLGLPLQVLGCVLARLLFLPAFLLAAHLCWPPVIMGVLTCALGVTNGFLTARVMTLGPGLVPHADADLAGNMLVFSLVAGLNAGAYLGWLWLELPGGK